MSSKIFTNPIESCPSTGPMYSNPNSPNKAPGVTIPLACISAFLTKAFAAGTKVNTVLLPSRILL